VCGGVWGGGFFFLRILFLVDLFFEVVLCLDESVGFSLVRPRVSDVCCLFFDDGWVLINGSERWRNHCVWLRYGTVWSCGKVLLFSIVAGLGSFSWGGEFVGLLW